MKKNVLLGLLLCLSFRISLATNFMINTVGLTYSPSSVAAQVGDQVTIQASGMHPFVQVSQANWNINNPVPLAGGLPSSTSTFTFTVTAGMIGTIYYGCENHMPGNAMKGTISVTSVLPLKITSFSANKAEGSVQLFWKTETETNTSHFEIEKSSNGITFNTIGNINAHGNSNIINTYAFTENVLDFATSFYRLKLVEISGEFSYSNVVRISNLPNKKTITISPNPVKNKLNVFTNSDLQTSVSICNSAGKIILQKSFNNSTEINTSLWEDGIYFVKFKLDNKNISKSFVVNHL